MVAGPPGGYVTALHARWLAEAPDQRFRALDATMLFADVSGFTKLGERLARKGRIGAEELSETVNTVFRGMLSEVHDRGGEILKFGGDAVLALFTGEQHALRGAAAGLGMQDMLRALRRSSGLKLRLSAGVATGTAHLFLAGGTPRELIVAGPLASEVCALESAAEAGEVLASVATAREVPSSCWRGRSGPGVLLAGRPPAAPAGRMPTAPAGFDPRPGLPLHLHEHVPGDAEHRPVTVAFLQFRGSDELLETEGPDALARAIHDVIGAAGDAALAHGVTFVATDVDRNAGKVILAAGTPTASPDDDDRMLHAIRTVLDGDHRLALRAGVNRGRVFTVDIGSELRRTFTVMGDAVNLAARVMSHAQPGTVLATGTVLSRLHDDFPREPVPPFTVKGKTAPVFAEQVGSARGARLSRAEPDRPLVGRSTELATIRGALEGAREGRDTALELVGEPGIGKSRLVEAAVADSQGLRLVGITGGPYAAHSPYRALRAPLRELLGARADEEDEAVEARLRSTVERAGAGLAPWLPLVAIPFGLDLHPTPEVAALSPEFARARLNAEASRVIRTLLPQRGVLLVIEDAHWLDEPSSDLLRHLVHDLRGHGTFVLLTRRDVTDGLVLEGEDAAVTLRLGPLEADAALDLLRGEESEDAPLPPGAEQALVERAAGNPLLLQELIAAARAGQPLDALPDSVEALVTARIDTLPRSDRTLLRHMSVLGVRVPTALLRELLGHDAFALAAALGRLEGFLIEDGPGLVRFRHALLRDAAYETLPFSRRRQLHGRAADLIEKHAGAAAGQQAELLTIHLHAARRWPETWHYAEIAGQQALDRAAPVEAAGFFAKALEAGRAMRSSPLELARLAERRGDALRLAGRFDEASTVLEEARRGVRGHPLREAALCLQIGRMRERSKHLTQALRWITRGLAILENEPPSPEAQALQAKMWLTRALVRVHTGRLRDAIRNAERAARLAEACGDRRALGHAYTTLHWSHTLLGSPERERFRGLALPIFEELGDREWQGKALNNLGVDAYWSGRWDEAVGDWKRGREALLEIGDVVEAAVLLNNIAEIRSDQGRLDEAEAQLREALTVMRGARFALGVGLIYSNLGRVASRRGNVGEAARLFEKARTTLAETGAAAMVLELDTREAERLVRARRHAAALELAGTIRRTAQECQAPPALMALNQRVAAMCKLQAGDVEGARVRLRESIEMARSVSAVYEEALSLDALARTGGPGAEEAAATAAELLSRLGVVGVPALPVAV